MDKVKALALEQKLKGQVIGNNTIIELLDFGKSAAVFKAASASDTLVATKIFDNDLIEKFGFEIQVKRINQELELIDHKIPNLISIIDGGSIIVDNIETYFIVMNLILGKNLKKFIQENDYDELFVQKVLKILFNVTNDLLKFNLVHRDIKPENIMVSNTGEIILMDLGVLKLIGGESFSDVYEKQFVGTLRYAPPEFIQRKEIDNEIGWNAINLYQIGAVAHDLIMKEELFYKSNPYPNLVLAIKEINPLIFNDKFNQSTLQFARDLLSKDWTMRNKLCDKERINKYVLGQLNNLDELEETLNEIGRLNQSLKHKLDSVLALESDNIIKKDRANNTSNLLLKTLEDCMLLLRNRKLFIEYNKSVGFGIPNDVSLDKSNSVIKSIVYMLKSNLECGLPRPLFLMFRCANDDKGWAEVKVIGIFIITLDNYKLDNPVTVYQQINEEMNGSKSIYSYDSDRVDIVNSMTILFSGIFQYEDNLINSMSNQIALLIFRSLKIVKQETELQIIRREQRAKGEPLSKITDVVRRVVIK